MVTPCRACGQSVILEGRREGPTQAIYQWSMLLQVIIESRKEAAERAQVEREREAEEQRQLAEALAREQEERRKQQER